MLKMPSDGANATPKDDLAVRLHSAYRGKVQTLPKCPLESMEDLAIWYTPGVAAASRAVAANRDLVYDLTNKGNTVAVLSDGSRVLRLGNIGPEAGLPVMEGKACCSSILEESMRCQSVLPPTPRRRLWTSRRR